MKALILWSEATSKNLGVRVLAAGAEALARRVWPDVTVELQDYGRGTAPLNIGDLKALAKEYLTGRRGLRAWLRQFDVVMDTRAGDSFSDIYGLRRLLTMSAVAELAHRLGVPVVLVPQTVGPFTTRAGKLLARRSLRTARLVMTRDNRSADLVRRLGREVDLETTDVVFALETPVHGPARDVIVNVSGLLWNENPHVDHLVYRRVVHDLVVRMRAAGRGVSLLAHVLDGPGPDNDVPAVVAAREMVGGDVEVVVPTSLDEARSILAAARLVVGSRMHACLNALSAGVPAVPLAYSRKFAPLLSDLGWDHSVDLRSSGDPVTEVMELSARTDQLRAEVETLLPRARRKVADAVQLLAAAAPGTST